MHQGGTLLVQWPPLHIWCCICLRNNIGHHSKLFEELGDVLLTQESYQHNNLSFDIYVYIGYNLLSGFKSRKWRLFVAELFKFLRDCLLEDEYDTLFVLGPHSFFISARPKHAEVY